VGGEGKFFNSKIGRTPEFGLNKEGEGDSQRGGGKISIGSKEEMKGGGVVSAEGTRLSGKKKGKRETKAGISLAGEGRKVQIKS